MENVWFKSRMPEVAGRETAIWVMRVAHGYAEIIRAGRRFKYSHEAVTHEQSGQTRWHVFEDIGPAT